MNQSDERLKVHVRNRFVLVPKPECHPHSNTLKQHVVVVGKEKKADISAIGAEIRKTDIIEILVLNISYYLN